MSRVISLFSGAGGMDLGFRIAGHELAWANDVDADCVDTYRFNLGDHVVLGDISELPESEIPDGEIIIGGFPCQGFSRANLKRSPEDSRNRLYLEFVRVLREKQPPYFVAENVRGILSLDGGKVVEMILQDFKDCGYRVSHHLVNLADFGVPQSRRRVFFLGTRHDIDEILRMPSPTHAREATLLRKSWVTIGEALRDIPDPEEHHDLLNHVSSQYKVTDRNFTGHRRTDPNKPSPTILARGDGGGGVCALAHPRHHRRLSVRESAIVQSFPLDFQFFGSLNSMYRQVGNAVPPVFAARLAEGIPRMEQDASEAKECAGVAK
ncbi:MAG: DNA cytosine methyltransferase [Gemmatimonadota bacterium]